MCLSYNYLHIKSVHTEITTANWRAERKTTVYSVNAAEMYYTGAYFTIKANIKLLLSLICAAATRPVTVTHILQLLRRIDWIRLILCVIHDSLVLSNHFCSSIMPSCGAARWKTQIERKRKKVKRDREGKRNTVPEPALVTNHQRPSSTAKISKFEPKLSGC